MKKKTLLILPLCLVAYAAVIWLVRSNMTARTVAKWVCGVSMAIWGLDWLFGQFAGLFSEDLADILAAAFLPISAVIVALAPLLVAVIIR